MKYKYLICTALMSLTSPAFAETDIFKDWQAEIAASLNYKTGNTESTDAGLGLKLEKKTDLWGHLITLSYDYGKSGGVKTKDRSFAGYHIDRKISERVYLYGDSTYEKDSFQGYDYRIFLGAGAGYIFLDTDQTFWSFEAAPGWRKESLTNGQSNSLLALKATNRYKYIFNENVDFSNDTSLIWTKDNTQITNLASLNAKLVGHLSARFSFYVEHNTKPPLISLTSTERKKKTDTTTRMTLVYTF